MTKDNPLRALLNQLNAEYNLSEEFKTKVLELINRLEGFNLQQEQLEILGAKVRETYERQSIVENSRKESQKSLEKIQSNIAAYSSALSNLNQKLNQAEAALSSLLNSRSTTSRPTALVPLEDNLLLTKERAKALVAFANMNSKNSRIH